VGMNAVTNTESTNYYYNFPATTELALVSALIAACLNPSFAVLQRARPWCGKTPHAHRIPIPQGRSWKRCCTASSPSLPAGTRRLVGDIENLRLAEAEQFYKTYYVSR